jgi:NDP-sugar pyrophosphorylase family protein
LNKVLSALTDFGVSSIHLLHNAKFSRDFKEWRDNTVGINSYLRLHNNHIKKPKESRGVVGDLGFVLEKLGFPKDTFVVCADNIFPESDYEGLAGNSSAIVSRGNSRFGNPTKIESASGVLRGVDNGNVTGVYCGPAFLHSSDWKRVKEYLHKDGERESLGKMFGFIASMTQVRVIKSQGYFYDVGSIEGYEEANRWARTFKKA